MKRFGNMYKKMSMSKEPNRTEKTSLVNIKSTQPFELISIDYLQLEEYKGQ